MGRDVRSLSSPPDTGKLLVKGLTGALTKRGASVSALPERSYLLMDQKQDLALLAGYDRVCGFTLRDDVPATSHPIPMTNVFREDVVTPGLTAEQALAGAPASEQQRFMVPRILGDEQ